MMQNVDIKVSGSNLSVDFARTGLDVKTLMDRAQEVLPLLYALLSADDVWLRLEGDDLVVRERGCLAMNMMCQSATQAAIERAKTLAAIACGSESISDHGFPEFDDGLALNV